jgi:hypothetical protein
MYQTVSPILYHSPIVQNLGLFLEGIQHPYESKSAPYHKIDLLDRVTNLSIIQASSTDPVKSPRLSILDNGIAPDPNAVDTFMVDRLGKSDLESWKLANVLSKSITAGSDTRPLPAILFKNLKALSFDIWDDGRWETYLRPSRDGRGPHYGTGRGGYLDSQIKDVLKSTATLQHIVRANHTCGRLPNGPYSKTPLLVVQTGITNIHASRIEDLRLSRPYPAHVRVYINIAIFEPYQGALDITMNMVQSAMDPYSSYDRLLYYAPAWTKENCSEELFDALDIIVELCIVTEEGDTEQHELAMKVKGAYERYVDHTAKSKGPPCGGELRILVGDQVPVCPCCGVA